MNQQSPINQSFISNKASNQPHNRQQHTNQSINQTTSIQPAKTTNRPISESTNTHPNQPFDQNTNNLPTMVNEQPTTNALMKQQPANQTCIQLATSQSNNP